MFNNRPFSDTQIFSHLTSLPRCYLIVMMDLMEAIEGMGQGIQDHYFPFTMAQQFQRPGPHLRTA